MDSARHPGNASRHTPAHGAPPLLVSSAEIRELEIDWSNSTRKGGNLLVDIIGISLTVFVIAAMVAVIYYGHRIGI